MLLMWTYKQPVSQKGYYYINWAKLWPYIVNTSESSFRYCDLVRRSTVIYGIMIYLFVLDFS